MPHICKAHDSRTDIETCNRTCHTQRHEFDPTPSTETARIRFNVRKWFGTHFGRDNSAMHLIDPEGPTGTEVICPVHGTDSPKVER